MWRILRWTLGSILVLALVPVAGAVAFWFHLSWNQPSMSGNATLAGLRAPVTVVRDGNAVPHVFADHVDDAYFALGWLHAQDRLFQMEMMRRVGAGRLSELIGFLGDFPVRIDTMMRTLGLYRHAEASMAHLSPEVRAGLDAYAAGVNAWLGARTVPLPIEFQLLWHRPEPWRPADSLVWGKLMALQLSGNYAEEIARGRMAEVLTPQQLDDLFPGDRPGTPATLAARLVDWTGLARSLPPPLGPSTASNGWALDPSRTSTGGAILANDPHLGLEAPILWYLARIVTPGLEITGGTVPGVPFHVVGQTGSMAWGLTTTGGDVQDLVVEQVDPADPTRYLAPDGPRPFTVRDEVIGRRFTGPLRITVRGTRNGPVISDMTGPLAPRAAPGNAVSLRFTVLTDADTTVEALYRMQRATSWEAFREALRLFVGPQQNIFYADRTGRLGFIAPAHVPIRGRGDGRMPVPGWDPAYDWRGTIPFDALPQAVDPPSGRFVNANNRVVGPDYPHLIAVDWPDAYRFRRIEQLLEPGRRQSLDTTEALMKDARSLAAVDLLPHMLATIDVDSAPVAQAAGLLRGWDGIMRRDRPEPLIFEWWLMELGRALWSDELGPAADAMRGLGAPAVLRILTARTAWCDDVNTAEAETCKTVVRRAFDRTLETLIARRGPHIPSWRWGDEHTAPLAHQILGRVPVIRDLIDISIATDGGFYTVNRGATAVSNRDRPFAHVHGAGYRGIYDLADPARSRFVIATGQSGNPLSPHWGDFVERWRDGRHVTIAGSREALERGGLGTVRLEPAR